MAVQQSFSIVFVSSMGNHTQPVVMRVEQQLDLVSVTSVGKQALPVAARVLYPLLLSETMLRLLSYRVEQQVAHGLC